MAKPVGRPPKDKITQSREMATQLEDLLREAANEYTNTIVSDEFTQLANYARIIREKLPRLATLSRYMKQSVAFAIINPDTHEVRFATNDEAQRLIMNYKQGSLLEVLRDWDTNENGEWIPATEDRTPSLLKTDEV